MLDDSGAWTPADIGRVRLEKMRGYRYDDDNRKIWT